MGRSKSAWHFPDAEHSVDGVCLRHRGTSMGILGIALVVIWLALNLGATICALRRGAAARERRIPLVVLVWAVPYVGALLAFLIMGREPRQSQPDASSETMA